MVVVLHLIEGEKYSHLQLPPIQVKSEALTTIVIGRLRDRVLYFTYFDCNLHQALPYYSRMLFDGQAEKSLIGHDEGSYSSGPFSILKYSIFDSFKTKNNF